LKGNKCYEVMREGRISYLQKMQNATEWERRSNDCVEYRCDNESGFVSMSICNSTDEASRFCLEGKCNTGYANSTNKDKVIVEIVLTEGVHIDEIDIAVLTDTISTLCSVSSDKLSVGYEVDGNGYILRVFVYIDDESTANVIATALTNMDKGKDCPYGILCRTKTVFVNGHGIEVKSLSVSGSRIREANIFFTLFMVISFSVMMLTY